MSADMGYLAACRRATTAQGLDPVVAAIAAAGIRVSVDQTGGFTMCVRVNLTHDQWLYITKDDGGYLVCRYVSEDEDNADGELVGEELTLDEVLVSVVALVRL
jgi:hypothetical protein